MRIKIYLTKAGLSFLGLLALFYYFSLITEIGLLIIIIGIFIGCYVLNLVSAYRTINKVLIEDFNTLKTTEKYMFTSSLTIANKARTFTGSFSLNSDYGTILRVSSIKPKETRHLTPEIIFNNRGVYPIDSMRIESQFPFSLVKVSRKIKIKGEFLVLPAVYDCNPPKASGFEPMLGGTFSGKHKTPHGNDFAGIRPFQSGDMMKQIHWKSSAKGLGLMVKEYTEELSGKISFIIDSTFVQLSDNESITDSAIRAAGSLIFASLDSSHTIEILNLKEQIIHTYQPFSDSDMILDYLARLEVSKNPYEIEKLNNSLSLVSKSSSLCFIFSLLNNKILNCLYYLAENGRVINLLLPHESFEYKRENERISSQITSLLSSNGIQIKYFTKDSIIA
ncbi:MAG TPA: hypothetical protein DD381_05765 [Lentisphaeria bacterium]|nr:MAG: hypothetical protein A2X47_08345 [Lentisphaerae bacterium GWF2_38_69]HBM15832.1 hypothetical protein [Lentisphaeria bacterium]